MIGIQQRQGGMGMRVCGVIAEYDPFHLGHAHQLARAREKTGADYLLCVMSGSFTQRGMPALLPAHTRAEMALRGGADIVLQLPYAFSVREAEYFALGGVFILEALGCVTHLSFGSEEDNLPLLSQAALLLERPDEAMLSALEGHLSQGLSHAEAMGRTLEARLHLPRHALAGPNTALALSYLRALLRLKSSILPVPILRTTSYHAAEIEAYPSASAMRGAILRGDWAALARGIPKSGQTALKSALAAGQCCPPGGLYPLLRRQLLFSSPEEIAAWPGVGEGLERRILRAAAEAESQEALLDAIKTRRYTRGRICRALCHGCMGIRAEDLPPLPDHARLLGFRESARPLLRQMQKSGFPLISQPARSPLMQMDIRADELWRIGAGLPLGDTYRQAPVIIRGEEDGHA